MEEFRFVEYLSWKLMNCGVVEEEEKKRMVFFCRFGLVQSLKLLEDGCFLDLTACRGAENLFKREALVFLLSYYYCYFKN